MSGSALESIRRAEIWEYGVRAEPLAEKLERIRARNPRRVAGGLDNQDTEHMLLCLLREQPDAVLDGLVTVGGILGAGERLLYLPEGEDELRESLKAKAAARGIRLEMGLADARYLRDGCFCHIETLAAVGGTHPGALVSIRRRNAAGDTDGAPVFVPFGERLPDRGGEGIKAVQIGARLYAPDVLEEPITRRTPLGNGVITLFDESCCMAAEAQRSLAAFREAGCGKCTFCREGFIQLDTRLREITAGKGEWAGLAVMQEIGEAMAFSCECSLGQTGAAFTLDTLRHFAAEYEDHIKRRRCTAGSCPAFITVYVAPEVCTGCGACIPACPEDCIEGLPGFIHMIERRNCSKCGACMEACGEGAIRRTADRAPRLPDRLTRVGRFKRY